MTDEKIPWRKLRNIATDLFRVNANYLSDGAQRGRMRDVLKSGGLDAHQLSLIARERAASPEAAHPYAQLAGTSLTLTGIRTSGDLSPRLNLAIGEVRPGAMFAGVHTALTTARELAGKLAIPLRVLMLDVTSVDNDRARAERFLRDGLGFDDVEVIPREQLRGQPFGSRDLWLASHWKTAHAVQVASTVGIIDPAKVAYLIQDYEPGFSPWSTESTLASSTYHAGFVPLVNSRPLWRYLSDEESLEISPDLVLAPRFEEEKLREAADSRRPSSVVRVLFYGRPSKPRNLYSLGIAALRVAVADLVDDRIAVEFYSAGETHPPVELGRGNSVTSLGRLAWDDYFRFLSTVQVSLSLQQSPHPSHPPFDAAISGATSVTNEFHNSRANLHPRIAAPAAEADALGAAVAEAVRNARGADPGRYLPVEDGLLGHPLDHALDALIARLSLT